MRILIVGGTRFVGRHIAAAALARGHELTVFHRGRTGPDLFPEAEHLLGDRDGDLAVLASGEWDATVDACAYVPRQVGSLAAALDGRGGHYALISSVSVYAAPPGPGLTEDSPLEELADPTVEDVDEHTYGGLKVLCERAAVDAFGVRSTLLIRPTYVVGPDDYTWRFPYWVQRLAEGGDVLAPGPETDPIQVIDARDMGDWVVRLLEEGVSGPFSAASPPPPFTWLELVSTIAAAVSPSGTSITWVDEQFLLDEGEDGASLPMWSGGDAARMVLAADPSAAYASGLRPRPLEQTIRDTLDWAQAQGLAAGGSSRAGSPRALSREREAELLARWRARR